MKKSTRILFAIISIIISLSLSLVITAPTGLVCTAPLTTLSTDNQNPFPEEKKRPEESTYLTFPEWYIVYSSEEYADFLVHNEPSRFPYFAGISQYWQSYRCLNTYAKNNYPFNGSNQLMLGVIGVSYSVEFAAKGIYENTIGKVFEVLSSNQKTEEEIFAQKVAAEYGQFLHTIPWFEFPFFEKLSALWKETSLFGPNFLRKWERKIILSIEYAIKGCYGFLIKHATSTVLGTADLIIFVRVDTVSEEFLSAHAVVKVTKEDASVLLELPRYEDFTVLIPQLIASGSIIEQIAGNDEIFATVLTPDGWETENTITMFEMNYLTKPSVQRVGLRIPVAKLHTVIPTLERDVVRIEHLYDY